MANDAKSTAPKKLVTRFAPSPTGYMHLGHAVHALYVWGLARKLGATILLRLEDHDRTRCRPEFEAAILSDLAWLGLTADALPVRQSDHEARYAAAIDMLSTKTNVYACDCSRKRIAASMTQQESELHYDGHCRDRALGHGFGVGIRAELASRAERFQDLLLGENTQNPRDQCGDVLIKDRHGCYTYQLAVVADDLADGVTLVIRGADIFPSTGRQIALARLLGRDAPPTFAHHPLLLSDKGEKLGKRFFSEALSKRRLSGQSADECLGEAAYAAGLIDRIEAVRASDVPQLFDGVALNGRTP